MNKKKLTLIAGVLIVLLGGFAALKIIRKPPAPPPVEEPVEELLPAADPSIQADAVWSKKKDNTVVVSVEGLGGKTVSLEYEITYETEGIIQGVNSGSKPIDVLGKDEFEREVYLGTCSRNVCKPHTGVKKVTVVLTFTDAQGKKSQMSEEYDL